MTGGGWAGLVFFFYSMKVSYIEILISSLLIKEIDDSFKAMYDVYIWLYLAP